MEKKLLCCSDSAKKLLLLSSVRASFCDGNGIISTVTISTADKSV